MNRNDAWNNERTDPSQSTENSLKHTVADAKHEASNLVDQAKQSATEAVSQAKQFAVDTLEDTKNQAQSSLDAQKNQAADRLSGVADVLRQTSQELGSHQEDAFAGYADNAAEQIEKLSGYLRDKNLTELYREVQGLAQRKPDLFLVGALAGGFLLARFLKSSSDNRAQSTSRNRYDNYGSYSQGTGSDYPRYAAAQSRGDYRDNAGSSGSQYDQYGSGRVGSFEYGSQPSSIDRYGTQQAPQYQSPQTQAGQYNQSSQYTQYNQPSQSNASSSASIQSVFAQSSDEKANDKDRVGDTPAEFIESPTQVSSSYGEVNTDPAYSRSNTDSAAVTDSGERRNWGEETSKTNDMGSWEPETARNTKDTDAWKKANSVDDETTQGSERSSS